MIHVQHLPGQTCMDGAEIGGGGGHGSLLTSKNRIAPGLLNMIFDCAHYHHTCNIIAHIKPTPAQNGTSSKHKHT